MCAKSSDGYAIFYSPAAGRDLKRLKNNRQVLESIDRSIIALQDEPRPPGIEHLGGRMYRKRDGDYRILYEVDDERRHVCVRRVRDRKDVYKH